MSEITNWKSMSFSAVLSRLRLLHLHSFSVVLLYWFYVFSWANYLSVLILLTVQPDKKKKKNVR